MLACAKGRRLCDEQADTARKEIARVIHEMTVAGKIRRNVVR